jgi:transcription initiation factor TFIIIB Brf1 subunit/transcription initiation factor TFIIB
VHIWSHNTTQHNNNTQFSEAVETPINVITRTIDEITKTEGLTSEVRSALSVIIKSLNSSNLYKPAFTKFLSKGALSACFSSSSLAI